MRADGAEVGRTSATGRGDLASVGYGAKGQGGDEERQSKYLLGDDDPNEIFGPTR